MCQKLIVIGCGPHFQSRYFPVLKPLILSGQICIDLIIDLDFNKNDILAFINQEEIDSKVLLLSEKYRNFIEIIEFDNLVKQKISNLVDMAVLICTEPKAHKNYCLWAISNELDIFCDKPITAFTSYYNNLLYNDYLEIAHQLNNAKQKINFVISCERRMHPGYIYLMQYIKDFINDYKMPITSLDIHFAGGSWKFPNEYEDNENHPFKYGYGVLLHSGYHYIDLFMQLINLNKSVLDFNISDLYFNILTANPEQLLNPIVSDFYQRKFGLNVNFNKNLQLGENDITITGQLQKDNYIYTNFGIKLIENSLSLRQNNNTIKNHYLDGGRVRQEKLIIHFGPLCSIYVTSNPYEKLGKLDMDSFIIEIMNNNYLTNKEAFVYVNCETLKDFFKDNTISNKMNIKSREEQLKEFLIGKTANSSFDSHHDSVLFLNNIYQQIYG